MNMNMDTNMNMNTNITDEELIQLKASIADDLIDALLDAYRISWVIIFLSDLGVTADQLVALGFDPYDIIAAHQEAMDNEV